MNEQDPTESGACPSNIRTSDGFFLGSRIVGNPAETSHSLCTCCNRKTMITKRSPRVILTETEPIVTPRDPKALHNFGPIACKEKTLYTAERPGHPGKDGVPTRIVEDWVQFIKSKGINNVLIIMDDDEFGVYEVDLKDFYQQSGLKVYHIPFSAPDSYERSMELIQSLDKQGEKVVSHCTGGKGRCGRVACAWLCKKWHMSPLEASQEFIDQAIKNGLYRLGDVQKLQAWIGYGSC